MKRSINFILALASGAVVLHAHAGCFVDAGSLAFGGYDVGDSLPRDSMLVVTLTCQEVQPRDLSVAIGPSATSGQIQTRQMAGGSLGDRLAYNLFVDASHTQVWGDGTVASAVSVLGVSRNSPRQLTVFGRIPARQNASVGTYSDAITITVDVVK